MPNSRACRDAQAALDAHEASSYFVLDGPQHALAMLLADLLHWSEDQDPRADIDAALSTAREMVAEDNANA